MPRLLQSLGHPPVYFTKVRITDNLSLVSLVLCNRSQGVVASHGLNGPPSGLFLHLCCKPSMFCFLCVWCFLFFNRQGSALTLTAASKSFLGHHRVYAPLFECIYLLLLLCNIYLSYILYSNNNKNILNSLNELYQSCLASM